MIYCVILQSLHTWLPYVGGIVVYSHLNNNVKRSNERDYETTDDFRIVQEASRRLDKDYLS